MLLHNTITGVIAAVMVALGAGQIGNTSTQVGEEPAGKNEVSVLMQERWYLAESTDPSNQTNPNTLILQSVYDGDIDTPCPGELDVCAVKLAIPTNADPSDFENQSLTNALSNGASVPAGGFEYAHKD